MQCCSIKSGNLAGLCSRADLLLYHSFANSENRLTAMWHNYNWPIAMFIVKFFNCYIKF